MTVPGVVSADLVVVQAGLVLGCLEALLDRPPGPSRGDQLRQRRAAGAWQVKKASSPPLTGRRASR